jgi:MFS family permease
LKILLTISSLLLSTAMLLIGHGMQLTVLPLRAAANGMPDSEIGLTASAYFFGFIIGCLYVPRLITRVGHIRVFAVLTAILASSILFLELIDSWLVWMLLRCCTGIAICGIYTVIESWLNTTTSPTNRGQILSVYTFIVLGSMAAGQLLVNVGPIDTSIPFIVAVLFLVLAIIPIGLTRSLAPNPVEPAHPSFALLYKKSHSAFAGALVSGLIAGSFWSLGAVFVSFYSDTQLQVTWLMTATIAGGALLQYPIGYLSDKVDRRIVMALLCLCGAISSVLVALYAATWAAPLVLFLFGATIMPIYAIALATAADVSEPDEFVQMGTSVLLLNAVGAVIAPLFIGQLMSLWQPSALFWSAAVLAIIFAGYIFAQLGHSRSVTVEEQTPFNAAASAMAPTSFDMDPRAQEEPADEEDIPPHNGATLP